MKQECRIVLDIVNSSNMCHIADYNDKRSFLKIINGKKSTISNPLEIAVHCSVIHPTILNADAIKSWSTNPQDGIGMILPIANRDLISVALDSRLTRSQKIKIACDVISSVRALHKSDYLHNDIKLDNFVMIDNKPHMTDFGFARRSLSVDRLVSIIDHTKIGGPYGTIIYMAPELLSSVGIISEYTEKTDVFSLGHLILGLLSGRNLLNSSQVSTASDILHQYRVLSNDNRLLSTIRNLLSGYDDQIIELVTRMLDLNKDTRCTMNDVVNSIFHNETLDIDVIQLEPLIVPNNLDAFTDDIQNITSVFFRHLNFSHVQSLFMAVDIYYRTAHLITVNSIRSYCQAASVWLAVTSTLTNSESVLKTIVEYFRIDSRDVLLGTCNDIIVGLNGIIDVNLLYYDASTVDDYRQLISEYFYDPQKYIAFKPRKANALSTMYTVQDLFR